MVIIGELYILRESCQLNYDGTKNQSMKFITQINSINDKMGHRIIGYNKVKYSHTHNEYVYICWLNHDHQIINGYKFVISLLRVMKL